MKQVRGASKTLGMMLVIRMLVVAGLLAVPSLGRTAEDTKQSPQEAVILYGDAANFQNNSAFDLALEEWEKFLTKFPKDPLAAKAQQYLGVCNLQLKRYEKAAAAFQAVITKYPKFDAIQDAYLNLGWCQSSLASQKVEGQYAKAAATFAEMAKKFPDGKYADQALFFWGESEYNQGKKKEALAPYEQLVKNHAASPLRRDALYALGVTYEELGQFAEAGKTYDLFLKEFPAHELATEVTMRKAETILQAGDFAAAEQMLGEIAAKEGFPAVDHALSRQAFCLSKLDKFAEAGDLYAKLATNFKDSSYAKEAAISAGRCYYRAERFPDAAKWLQTVVDRGGGEAAEAAHWLCRIHLRNHEPQKTIALSKAALPKAGDSPFLVNLKMDQADALYEIADSKPQSIAAYLTLVKEHGQHELAAQALYNAGFTALELKQPDEGLKHVQAFLKAYPQDRLLPDVKYVAAESHLLRNQPAEAEKIYRELTASAGERAEGELWKVRLGLAIYLQKKYQEVITALEPLLASLKGTDNLAEAQFLIGASQFQLGNFDAAAKALQAALQANPKWRQADETLLFLSRVQRQQDKLQEALATVRKLLADFPDSPQVAQAHYRLGEYSYAATDYKTAIGEYDEVLTRTDSPFVPYALYGKAWAQMKSNAYAAAAADLTTLLKDHAGHALLADATFARAMCRRQAGELDGALEDVNAYLATKPELNSRSDALYERGLVQVALKQLAAAAATFQEVLKANEKYAGADKVLYELAWAYKSMDDKAKNAEAVTTFGKLATTFPESPLAAEANFHVGEAAYEKHEYAEAAKAYAASRQKVAQGDLGEKVRYKLGWANFQQKQYDPALSEFTDQLQEYPQGALHAEALFMKAECLFRQEKYTEALAAYQAAQKAQLSSPTIQLLALLHAGQSASQLKQWDVALATLAQIGEKSPDSPYLAEANYELGWVKQNSGHEDEALKAYEEAATQSRVAVGARARFMIGELYFNRKEHAEAIRHFQRVMFGYGAEKAAEDVKKWQAKAGFEAGRCTEVQIQDAAAGDRPTLIADAKKFYQYVIEKHPQDELVAKAKQRVATLAKL